MRIFNFATVYYSKIVCHIILCIAIVSLVQSYLYQELLQTSKDSSVTDAISIFFHPISVG